MNSWIKSFLAVTVGIYVCAAHAAWPDKPIKLVVPYPAGGAADNTARILALQLGERLKQQVIVDNRPGASGTIGAAFVAKAPPDGYTLLLDATSYTVNPSLFPKLAYDPDKDLVPVSQIMQVPLLLVVPANSPFASVADVVKAAKDKPGKLSFASAGSGGAQHLAAELFAQSQKIEMTHIPYKGGAPALTDLIGGQVDLMFSATTASAAFVKGGKLKALGITSAKRLDGWPQVPTIAEGGVKGFEVNEWNGLFAPAGTPPAILDRLEAESRAAVAAPAVAARFAELGVQGVGSSSKDFASFVKTETAKWARVIKAGNIKAD
jgi:tripartite-type tricarboxylate transporter receptor subunit TctC